MSNGTCFIGGVEGGATHSTAVILDASGEILAMTKGPGTNHHLTGMVECRRRIAEMVNQAKNQASIPLDEPLAALGMSLSGCEQECGNLELSRGFLETYPQLSAHCSVASDTEGSIATTSNRGGVTCIAGTGSNTLLINPDGARAQCGGWGNILGDEGSAWRIAYRSVKICFNDLDNFERAPFGIERIWEAVRHHFGIEGQPDILDYFYGQFDKARIASLCKQIAELARSGDQLAQLVFKEAGRDLARFIAAVYGKADTELLKREGGLHVLCVGSVWLSFDLLKSGFVTELESHPMITALSLMKLNTPMAVGAAYMAADNAHLQVKRNYAKNYTVFFTYKRGTPSATRSDVISL